MIRYLKLWNNWRKIYGGLFVRDLLVLIRVKHSITFENALMKKELKDRLIHNKLWIV